MEMHGASCRCCLSTNQSITSVSHGGIADASPLCHHSVCAGIVATVATYPLMTVRSAAGGPHVQHAPSPAVHAQLQFGLGSHHKLGSCFCTLQVNTLQATRARTVQQGPGEEGQAQKSSGRRTGTLHEMAEVGRGGAHPGRDRSTGGAQQACKPT